MCECRSTKTLSKKEFMTAIMPAEKPKIRVQRPRPISLGDPVIIPATAGNRHFAGAHDVFDHVDPQFANLHDRYNVWSGRTAATRVEVCEMVDRSNARDMFESFGPEPEELSLTQSQCISFAETHKRWLDPNEVATFFLVRTENKLCRDHLFLAFMTSLHGKLKIHWSDLESDYVWAPTVTTEKEIRRVVVRTQSSSP
jgi:hypothetical protein